MLTYFNQSQWFSNLNTHQNQESLLRRRLQCLRVSDSESALLTSSWWWCCWWFRDHTWRSNAPWYWAASFCKREMEGLAISLVHSGTCRPSTNAFLISSSHSAGWPGWTPVQVITGGRRPEPKDAWGWPYLFSHFSACSQSSRRQFLMTCPSATTSDAFQDQFSDSSFSSLSNTTEECGSVLWWLHKPFSKLPYRPRQAWWEGARLLWRTLQILWISP